MDRSGRPTIGDILARIDLAALLDELAAPAAGHSGRTRRWHCPVAGHDDAHASVTMYTDGRGHQRWRCWSGADDHRGDAIDLVVAVRRLSRHDAIAWLANRIGHTATPAPRRPRPAADRSNASVALDPTVVVYAQRCAQLLWTATGAPVRRWLHERGFNDDVLRVNQIGADPGRRALARRRGLPAGGGPAATFPALDTTGTIRYVQARYLAPRAGQPKYDNPASRLASNPRLAWLQPTLPRDHLHLVICEGIPDALTAAQAGFRAAAMLGSCAADQHVARALANYANAQQLALSAVIDADPAGRGAGERLANLLADHNTTLRIVEPPDGLDQLGTTRSELDQHPRRHTAGPKPSTRTPRAAHGTARSSCQPPACRIRPARPSHARRQRGRDQPPRSRTRPTRPPRTRAQTSRPRPTRRRHRDLNPPKIGLGVRRTRPHDEGGTSSGT